MSGKTEIGREREGREGGGGEHQYQEDLLPKQWIQLCSEFPLIHSLRQLLPLCEAAIWLPISARSGESYRRVTRGGGAFGLHAHLLAHIKEGNPCKVCVERPKQPPRFHIA